VLCHSLCALTCEHRETQQQTHMHTHTHTQVHTNTQTHAHTPATHAHCFGATPLAIFEAAACVQFQMPVCTKQMNITPCIQTIDLDTHAFQTLCTYIHTPQHIRTFIISERERARERDRECVCVLVCVNCVCSTVYFQHTGKTIRDPLLCIFATRWAGRKTDILWNHF
jgi:hypothetical protein